MLMMLMMPVLLYLNPVKIVLLALLVILCFKDARVCRANRFLCGMLCMSSILATIVGLLRGTTYPFYGMTIWVMWPIASLIILTPLLKTNENYKTMIKWMFYMHSFLVVYDLIYALSVVNGTPLINIYPDLESGFSFYDTTSRMSFVNLNTLTFTTPLFFLLYLTRYDFGVNSKAQVIILLLNFFLLLFSGRRSLMAIFILAPIFTIVFRRLFPHDVASRTKRYLFILLIVILGALGYVYTTMPEVYEGYLYTFTKAFDSDEEPLKFYQAKMLWGQFVDKPIFGAGAGAVFYEPFRGSSSHQFELTYFLKLATGGVVGFLLYIIGTIGVLLVGARYAVKRNDVLFVCILFAFFFVLLADATNPVLCSFDLMIPLYICYAKINSCSYNYDNIKKIK